MTRLPFTRKELDECIKGGLADARDMNISPVYPIENSIMRLASEPREANTSLATAQQISELLMRFKGFKDDPNDIFTEFENNTTGLTYAEMKFLQNLVHYAVQYGINHGKRKEEDNV